MTTALLSVSDKTGIVEFARSLHAHGIQLLSTGGTAKLLAESGLPVTEVSEITGFPEMLDGRVKTLHPRVHGGLLARRDVPAHMAALKEHGIDTIDLLIINLYPFAQATAKADCTLEDAIENIDIGGPAMLRAAAKNWQDVGVVIDPTDYPQVLAELAASNGQSLTRATKFMLAKKVFSHTAAYDGMISNYLTALEAGSEEATEAVPARAEYPSVFNPRENPAEWGGYHEEAAEGPGGEGAISIKMQVPGLIPGLIIERKYKSGRTEFRSEKGIKYRDRAADRTGAFAGCQRNKPAGKKYDPRTAAMAGNRDGIGGASEAFALRRACGGAWTGGDGVYGGADRAVEP